LSEAGGRLVEFRKWKEGKVTEKPSLRGIDLSGLTLTNMDLSGADLTCADLTRTTFQGCDLREADFRRANLTRTEFFDCLRRGALRDPIVPKTLEVLPSKQPTPVVPPSKDGLPPGVRRGEKGYYAILHIKPKKWTSVRIPTVSDPERCATMLTAARAFWEGLDAMPAKRMNCLRLYLKGIKDCAVWLSDASKMAVPSQGDAAATLALYGQCVREALRHDGVNERREAVKALLPPSDRD
jgi:hypothetical protein